MSVNVQPDNAFGHRIQQKGELPAQLLDLFHGSYALGDISGNAIDADDFVIHENRDVNCIDVDGMSILMNNR